MSGSTSGATYVGSGSDSIALQISEDQAEGQDAQFTVQVDGKQIGGLQTATASHSAGQDQTFVFQGNYGPGQHTVAVTFENNLILPGDSGDRNLYVDGVSYDGQTVSDSTTAIYNAPLFPPNSTSGPIYGNATYTVNDTTAIPDGAGANPTDTPGAVSVGSGNDTLVLNMGEDYYQGDAQFTVSVDGQQIGGTLTTTAKFDYGQQQEFDIHGNFGAGTHSVAVTFLNDAIGAFYAGTTDAVDTTDRNLYIYSASIDGGPSGSGAPWELASDGTQTLSVTSGNNTSVGSSSDDSATSATTTTAATTTAATSSDTTPATTTVSTSDTTPVTTASVQGSADSMSFVSSPSDATTAATSTDGSTGQSTDLSTAAAASGDTNPTGTAAPDTSSSSGTGTWQGFSPSGNGGGWWDNHSGDHMWAHASQN